MATRYPIAFSPTQEQLRLADSDAQTVAWKKWGLYPTERQWSTVREDYSADGNAWNYITHDMARSYAYRWGEEGIGGISDARQRLCFAVARWNGQDNQCVLTLNADQFRLEFSTS